MGRTAWFELVGYFLEVGEETAADLPAERSTLSRQRVGDGVWRWVVREAGE